MEKTQEMSETVRGLTPTYQSILIKRLDEVCQAINMGNNVMAFRCLRTLIFIMLPADRKKLLDNDVRHINKRIGFAKMDALDLYLSRSSSSNKLNNLLGEDVINLFTKVMDMLHDRKMLTIGSVQPRNTTESKLEA